MEELFVPYTEAVALKELGFDKPCIAHYIISTKTMDKNKMSLHIGRLDYDDIYKEYKLENIPTYSQAFKWFRDKHKLHAPITDNGLGQYDFRVGLEWSGRIWDTYQEAELECLRKLIEIVKEN